MNKKILIAIAIILLLIASFLVYKKFKKKEPVAIVQDSVVPVIEVAPVIATSDPTKDALRSELSILTPKLAAEKYKLYNMEQYAGRLKANPTTTATALNSYYNDVIVPQQRIVGDLESKIGQISTVLNA